MPTGVYKHKKGGPFKMTEKIREKISKTLIGHIPWNKGIKTGPNPEHSKRMTGRVRSVESRKRQSISEKGEKGSNWRGGVTPINQIIRHSLEYKLWRTAVFERDDYTCIWCGAKSGKGNPVVLNADHIKPFAYYPELRFAIDNGRTLCIGCHKTTKNYMRGGENL